MIIIGKESKLVDVFGYKNVAVFSTTTSKKGCEIAERTISYKQLGALLPSNDDISAVVRGERKLKGIIKAAVKKLRNPKAEGAADIGLSMAMLITAATSDRRNKNGPPVLVFVLDDDDDGRNKVITKYLVALFSEFGIKPVVKNGPIKGIFSIKKKELKKVNKGRKKKDRIKAKTLVKHKLAEFESDKDNKCTLNNKGVELKRQLLRYYDIELRQMAASELEVSSINGSTVQSWAKALVRIYSGENLRDLGKKAAKLQSKRDRQAVKYYNEIRDIMASIHDADRLPKVKFGQKKKKGRAVGPKMNTKKFIKYFAKYRNRGLLMLVFAHSTIRLLGKEIGSKEYNQQMKATCNLVGEDGFAKVFLAAASAYADPEKASK